MGGSDRKRQTWCWVGGRDRKRQTYFSDEGDLSVKCNEKYYMINFM